MRWKNPKECDVDRSVIEISRNNGNNRLSEDEYSWLIDKENNHSINYHKEWVNKTKKPQTFKYDRWVCSIEMPKKLAVEFFLLFG